MQNTISNVGSLSTNSWQMRACRYSKSVSQSTAACHFCTRSDLTIASVHRSFGDKFGASSFGEATILGELPAIGKLHNSYPRYRYRPPCNSPIGHNAGGTRRVRLMGSMSALPFSRQLTLNFRFVVIQEEQTRSWVVGPVEENTTLIGCLMRSSQRRRSPL